MSRKRIKSNSGKDIRDIIYTNEDYIFNFEDEDDYEAFLDYATNVISYFGYISIQDILGYYGKEHDFISATDYGWGIEDLDRFTISVTNENNELVVTLPKPKPLPEIIIPCYMG